MFKVIKKVNPIVQNESTLHIRERSQRVDLAERLIENEGAIIIGAWEVDTGHWNGHEVHNVYDNGVIKIFNQHTKKYVTALIGRIGQVKRYGIEPTMWTVAHIRRHVDKGYNEI